MLSSNYPFQGEGEATQFPVAHNLVKAAHDGGGKVFLLMVGPQYDGRSKESEILGDVVLLPYRDYFEAAGIPKEDMTILCDSTVKNGVRTRCATKNAIQGSFRDVMTKARPGDKVIVLFSAHTRRSPEEDYPLVPSGGDDITREEFREMLTPPTGVEVIAFIDTCFCGNILDLLYTTDKSEARAAAKKKLQAKVVPNIAKGRQGRANPNRKETTATGKCCSPIKRGRGSFDGDGGTTSRASESSESSDEEDDTPRSHACLGVNDDLSGDDDDGTDQDDDDDEADSWSDISL